jgi:hypothetical protein
VAGPVRVAVDVDADHFRNSKLPPSSNFLCLCVIPKLLRDESNMGPERTIPTTSRTRIFNRPEIQFRQQTDVQQNENGRSTNDERGDSVATFYRSITSTPVMDPPSPEIIIIDPPDEEPPQAELCPICQLPLPSSKRLQRRHNASVAHLAKVVDRRPPPVNPLPINRSSFGYKVLNSQGWSDRERHGIGADDNKGRREPIKTSRVKNDTVGLGIKGKKIEEAIVEKKLIQSGKDIQKAYEREKQIRKELMDYMR